MAVNNNIEKPSEKGSAERENFFEAIENEFKAGNGDLVEIADRKEKEWKLSFFDKVKDFFENPYAGIKYLSSRVFGREITKFMYELKETSDNLSKAKENVQNVASTALDKTKKVIESIPDDIKKNVPIAGSVIASAMKVKDYFIKNSLKAAEMPKDKSKRMVWWKEIMKAAGVKEGKLVENTLLELLAETSNWTDVRDKLEEKITGKEYEKDLDKRIESGEFGKEWPFTGEKIGPAAKKAGGKLKKYGSDISSLIKDNPSLSAALVAYTGYKMGPKAGINAVGLTGKMLLKVGLAPLKYTKNNPKKVILFLIAGRLIQQNTRWDEIAGKSLANLKLPKDYEEFNKVITSNPAYKEAMNGVNVSKKEFESAMEIMNDETKFGESMDDILESIKPKNVVKAGLSVIGKTPKENIKDENLKGFIKARLMILSEDNKETLKKSLGSDYEKLVKVLGDLERESRSHELGEVSIKNLKKLNEFSEITKYEISISDNFVNLVYSPIDPLEEKKVMIIGPNPNLSASNKELIASTIKRNIDFMEDGELKEIGEYAALGDVFALKLRQMFGVSTETLLDSPDTASKLINEKMKKGEAGLVQSGYNFSLKYGTEYILLPFTVVEHLTKYMFEEDYTVSTGARVYANGLGLVSVIGTAKFVGGIAMDKVYDFTVASKTGLTRTPDGYKMKAAKAGFKAITYPLEMPYRYGKGLFALRKVKADGLQKVLSSTAGGEIIRVMKNMYDTAKIKRSDRFAQSMLSSKEAKASIENINNTRISIIALRDTHIYMNNLSAKQSKSTLYNANLIKDLVERYQKAGLTDEMARIMKVKPEKFGEIQSFSPEQLRELMEACDDMLSKQKQALRVLKPGVIESVKSSKIYSTVSEWRKMQKATEVGRMTKLSKAGRLAKGSSYAALGAIGVMAVSQYFDRKDIADSSPELKETPVQEKIANEIIGAEVKLMKEVFNPKLAKEFQTHEDYEKRKEVMNGMKNSYLNTYNSLMNFMVKNQKLFNGGVDEIAKILQSKLPEAKFKIKEVNNYFSKPDKVLSFGMGSIQIIEKPDGSIQLGRMDVDQLEENMNMFGKSTDEILTDVGTGLIPLYGTGKDFYRSYEASQIGNSEKATGEFFFGVSSLASDIALPLKAGGVGLKLLGNSAKLKNLGKVAAMMEKMNDAAQVSSKVGKGATAGAGVAIGAMGYDIFDEDINTYTKIAYE